MRVVPEAAVASEVAALRALIEREAAATEMALSPGPLEDAPGSGLPGRDELWRQLAALRGRAARAPSGTLDQHELRAELATLLFFANTLRSDAQVWRAGVRQAVEELKRKEATERRERERVAAEEAELVRRRDALQIQIDREAERMAHRKGGECRRTVPVITLRPGFTVSSMTVSRSRRRFRSLKLWLVTLDERHGVLVIRD